MRILKVISFRLHEISLIRNCTVQCRISNEYLYWYKSSCYNTKFVCFLLLNLKTDDYIWQPFLYKSATLIDLNSHQASTNFIFVFCQSFHKTLLRYLVSEHSVFKTKIKRRSTNLCTTAQMCVLPVSFPVDLLLS